VEARLTLTPTADGGRKHPVFTDYRPDWNIGNRAESGETEINGAPSGTESGTVLKADRKRRTESAGPKAGRSCILAFLATPRRAPRGGPRILDQVVR
jgi:hypothetical protein